MLKCMKLLFQMNDHLNLSIFEIFIIFPPNPLFLAMTLISLNIYRTKLFKIAFVANIMNYYHYCKFSFVGFSRN